MRLAHPFYKFPLRFDAARLVEEVRAFPESAWQVHPNRLQGNSFLQLVSTYGQVEDGFEPPMRPTPFLQQAPYIRQVLSEFRTLVGRARLMRLEPGDGVPWHVDNQQYWRRHTRIHVPIVTDPAIRFHCGDDSVHMAAGEAWTFDNRRLHQVVNQTPVRRIHLVMDTYGSAEFWRMAQPRRNLPLRFVPYRPGYEPEPLYESYGGPAVLSPAEVELELADLVEDARQSSANAKAALEDLDAFALELTREWRTVWHLLGPEEGLEHFRQLTSWARQRAATLPPDLTLASSNSPLAPALGETLGSLVRTAASVPAVAPAVHFDRPLFIVAAPRSGSSWLYEMLAQNFALQSLGGEGHHHIEHIAGLGPQAHNWASNRLTDADATPDIIERLRANYLADMRDVSGRRLAEVSPRPPAIRFLEKTPKNALRIPFLRKVFPDARFIFLHRAPGPNVSAIMDAWRSGRFVTYPALPGWPGPPWSLLLIPGWEALVGAPLSEIALRQWAGTNQSILNDLAGLPRKDWMSLSYEALQKDPAAALRRVCAFAEIPFGEAMHRAASESGRPSRHTLSAPDAGKWLRNAAEIEPLLPRAEALARRLADSENEPVGA